MRASRIRFILGAGALALVLGAHWGAAPAAAAEVPFLTGRVVDEVGAIGSEATARIEGILQRHDEQTTNQIAVLIVRTLDGEEIESYAERVFRTWKLGRKGRDNGVLVVVATDDRRMRIEVGYGLEEQLTDGVAGAIIRGAMAPRFKAGDYAGGVEAGVLAIVGALEGNAGAVPQAPEPLASEEGSPKSTEGLSGLQAADMPWYARVLLGAFIFGIIGLFTVIGVLTPGMGWFLYAFLIPFWAMFPIVIVGAKGAFALLATYVVGFPIAKIVLKRQPWYHKAAAEMKAKGQTSIGGFTVTSGGWSSSSGGSSDSGSSGGGFSGGGGSSGGGGASGSW